MTGELVMERFRLHERIGSGGMGTVYRAFDERLQRDVAVKEVMVGDPDRVVREAQAAARLNHPGIVSLFELGVDGHRALLVSELVAGSTLSELACEGQLCDRDVAELGSDVCEALEHAHANGVIHRDVKPQNVIARDDDGAGRRAKLMDFGIASLAGAPTLTATGEIVGTLAYMSPEQAEGAPAAPESDTYSLALTLYECWAGENPVRRATPAQTARELGSPLPPLLSRRPDLPRELAVTVDACLDPEPDRRPSLAELRDALEHAIPRLDDEYAVPAPAHSPAATGEGWRPEPGRLAGGAAVVLAVPLVVWLGAVSLMAALPAAVAVLGRTAPARAVLGAVAWCYLLVACSGLNLEPPAGLDGLPASGLAEPTALLGMVVFATAAVALGALLAARHVAMALLGTLVWAAGFTAALGAVGDGGLGETPLVIAASGLVAVLAEFRPWRPARMFASRRHAGGGPRTPATAARGAFGG